MLLAGFGAPVHAQADYPARPLRLIVPFPPGGGGDGVARPIATLLAERLGQPVVIDNRGGAGGIIGTELAARAAPDGYTLFLGTTGLAALPGLHRGLAFDPVRSFAPVTNAVSGTYVLVVPPQAAAQSVSALLQRARGSVRKPGYASAGVGTTIHLAGELFGRSAGVQFVHVPYQGAARAITDVMSGQVEMMFATLFLAMPQMAAGRLRGLGVTSATRSRLAPDLPTIAESGLPGFAVTGWYGFVAPAGTAAAITARLHGEVSALLRQPATEQKLNAQGLEVVADTPVQFANFIRDETLKWTRVVREAGLRAD